MKTLYIIGRIGKDDKGKERGEMAKELVAQCEAAGIDHFLTSGGPLPANVNQESFAVYLGKKERFAEYVHDCERHNLTLIVASSGITSADVPEGLEIPVVLAPNLALLIMAIFKGVSDLADMVNELGGEARVMEIHQQTKDSPPGTAHKIAGLFNKPPESVTSVRNNVLAKDVFGIPEEYLGAFGYHQIDISACGANAVIIFKTLGRSVYFKGLMYLIRKIEAGRGFGGPGIFLADRIIFG